MKKLSTKQLASLAMLVAIEIILSRCFSITTPIVKISISFIPLSMIGMLYGPVYSTTSAAIADLIGAALFPVGVFFPGYTLTAALTGCVYGIFLYNRPKSFKNIIIAVLVIDLCLRLGLNTYWTMIFTGKGYLALLVPRILKTFVTIPLEVVGIKFIWEKLCPILQK